MTNPPSAYQRLLDRIAAAIWQSQDARLIAAGFEVTRIGRWRRSYRRPLRSTARRPTRPAAVATSRSAGPPATATGRAAAALTAGALP
ncbi:MAG: hypothetical protein ACRDT4_17335 [Micromonosporaceae bacterium]